MEDISSTSSEEDRYDEYGQKKIEYQTKEDKDQERRRRCDSGNVSDASDELETTRKQWNRKNKKEFVMPGQDDLNASDDQMIIQSGDRGFELDLDYNKIKA